MATAAWYIALTSCVNWYYSYTGLTHDCCYIKLCNVSRMIMQILCMGCLVIAWLKCIGETWTLCSQLANDTSSKDFTQILIVTIPSLLYDVIVRPCSIKLNTTSIPLSFLYIPIFVHMYIIAKLFCPIFLWSRHFIVYLVEKILQLLTYLS